ncbi:CLUMA_CG001574, isoform A [Clunio marinus]|uniref:CLUMA_CG001574, isoform A n=1 Tax=Clunio marinus TaxID=568069 RepID=A0A1J1HJT5_9DIPT|nr:CLUMA_CG001574, isoform A [Clunio marinus]
MNYEHSTFYSQVVDVTDVSDELLCLREKLRDVERMDGKFNLRTQQTLKHKQIYHVDDRRKPSQASTFPILFSSTLKIQLNFIALLSFSS